MRASLYEVACAICHFMYEVWSDERPRTFTCEGCREEGK